MGLLGKIFGNKKPKGPIKTNIDLLPSLLNDKFEKEEKELEQYNAKKLSEIKHTHRKALMLLADIQKKEIQEAKNARFNKAAMTAKQQVEKQLEQLLKKLNPDGRGQTLEDGRAYAGEGYALMITEINTFRKSIVYTSAFLKEEMSELGKVLQELINTFNDMNNTYKKSSDLFEFEKVKKSVKTIQEQKKEIIELKLKKENNLKLIEEKKSLLLEQKKDIENFKQGEGMEKLNELEKEKRKILENKQELKLEVASLIASVDRPLQRFKSLSDSGRWVLRNEDREILDLVMTNPLIALKKDPKAERFKSILGEVKKAIIDGKVELKEKEMEKRLNALDELLVFDFFENVFWKLNDIQKRQDQINKELSENVALKELNVKEDIAKETEKEIHAIEDDNFRIDKEIISINEKITKEINSLKMFATKALEREVTIEE
jgi:hypothetical protein